MHEMQRLNNLLQNKKITEVEYQLLLNALNKPPSWWRKIYHVCINPFEIISGERALIYGVVILVLMSIIGIYAKMYYIDFQTVLNATARKNMLPEPNFFLLAYQNGVNWLLLASGFYIAAHLFRQKGTRVIDFIGMAGLARFPTLVLAVIVLIFRIFYPDMLVGGVVAVAHPTLLLSTLRETLNLSWLITMIWQTVVYFFALKESSGLNGNKLWISFIVTMLVGNGVAHFVATIFLKIS